MYCMDILILGRRPIHHLGDYSGLFSLGLGWLHNAAYVYFPWPLWGIGQLSALTILALKPPVTSLDAFYIIWAGLNVLSSIAAAWLTALGSRDLKMPLASALVLGLIAATMPALSVGWLNSNPYFPLGVLLVPSSLVLLNRLAIPSKRPLLVHEYISLGALGWIVANNFGALIILLSALFATCVVHARSILSGKRDLSEILALRLLREVLAAGVGVAVASLASAAVWRLHAGFDLRALILAAVAMITYGIGRQFRFRVAEFLVRPAVALLAGWIIGANMLVFVYGYAARIATQTATAPSSISLYSLIPQIEVTNLTASTFWFWLIPICYGASICALIAAPFAGGPRSRLLTTAALFSLCVLALTSISTNAGNAFPIGFDEIRFGLYGRYLWLGISTSSILIAAAISYRHSSLLRYCVLAFVGALGILSFEQSVTAKRAIIAAIDQTISATDLAIDTHLAKSPSNVVLIANAYFPSRAQILYAYHNSILVAGLGEPAELQDSRIQYIGRFGGDMWVSPSDIMARERLSPKNILIIAEGGDYPKSIEIIKKFTDTNTWIARPATANDVGK
jgi:hypothetical protein